MITVLVVDDSALERKLLSELLNSDPDIEVIATAIDPYDARDKIKKLNPDVLTLDIEMPKMDGITFLNNLMRLHPMPVVMVSTLTQRGAKATMQALQLGAVDFVEKLKLGSSHTIETYRSEIISKVKVAAQVNLAALDYSRQNDGAAKSGTINKSIKSVSPKAAITNKLIGIGASTGGTEAIREILSNLPVNSPPIVIAQHIPATFSHPFAARVNNESEIEVCVAEDGQQVLEGHAYIAPGDQHLTVESKGGLLYCKLSDGVPVNHHKPSVDVLFQSLAQLTEIDVTGVILTGMGADGAKGLLEMKAAGGFTFVQDEKTSIVWGMPGQAIKLGAAELQLPLKDIAAQLIKSI
mgnify:CR=1 FL=1